VLSSPLCLFSVTIPRVTVSHRSISGYAHSRGVRPEIAHLTLRRYEDISFRILANWLQPIPLPPATDLVQFLDSPLPDESKLPISQAQYSNLISRNTSDYCAPDHLDRLFRISNTQSCEDIWLPIISAIKTPAPSSSEYLSENLYIHFWDTNICKPLQLVLPEGSPLRDSSRHTSTGMKRPDFGYLMDSICVFRGEEKGPSTPGDPKAELTEKLKWIYDPAPYVLGITFQTTASLSHLLTTLMIHAGYYASADRVTFTVLQKPAAQFQHATVLDIGACDLRLQRERIKNIARLVRIMPLIKSIAKIVAWSGSAEFITLTK
jgi:hypothetical protein